MFSSARFVCCRVHQRRVRVWTTLSRLSGISGARANSLLCEEWYDRPWSRRECVCVEINIYYTVYLTCKNMHETILNTHGKDLKYVSISHQRHLLTWSKLHKKNTGKSHRLHSPICGKKSDNNAFFRLLQRRTKSPESCCMQCINIYNTLSNAQDRNVVWFFCHPSFRTEIMLSCPRTFPHKTLKCSLQYPLNTRSYAHMNIHRRMYTRMACCLRFSFPVEAENDKT